MSQQRETFTHHETDAPPSGDGWRFAGVSGSADGDVYITWVREPVPDAWQAFSGKSGMCFVAECEPGYEPAGPWEPHCVTSTEQFTYTHWRRPLRRIEAETLVLPDGCEETEAGADGVALSWKQDDVRFIATISRRGTGCKAWQDGMPGGRPWPCPLPASRYLLARYAQLNGGAA